MLSAAAPAAARRRADLRRIGPLVALVVTVHAAALALPRQVPMASGSPSSVAQAIQFRLVAVTPGEASAPLTTTSTTAPRMLEPPPAVLSSAIEPLMPSREAEMPALDQPQLVPAAPTWLGVALPGITTDDDRFFPRSLLSAAPAAMQPVLIDYPVFEGDAGRYASELSLFIDEQGNVVKVRVDGEPLPPPLEAAARSAFLNARFRPGEAAELGVVKSRIRVEVVFDQRDAPRGG